MNNLEIIAAARERAVAEQTELRKQVADLETAQEQSFDETRDRQIRVQNFRLVMLTERVADLERTEAMERYLGGR